MPDGDDGFAQFGSTRLGNALASFLAAEEIVPGSPPSYETCKTIFVYHPLGQKIAEGPVNMAQSQEREITVPGHPESRLIPAFKREWAALGGVGADVLIHNLKTLSRVYGISTLAIGTLNGRPDEPLPIDRVHELDLFFNVFDPLNTAGSLVLNQDPNAPDFQKPLLVRAGGKEWHPSRTIVMMNEQPIYIEFTNSAFGFVGRSVYQRGLYPLKTFVESMVTDHAVVKKIGLLVWKAKSPTSAINNLIMSVFSWKRQQLKSGVTGNVIQIGADEAIESINFQNLEGPYKLARENNLKNIATAAGGMPARMLDMETLAEGFGEGQEDAKQIARFVDRIRIEMQPAYAKLDDIVQRKAWTPDFYKDLQKDFPEYRRVAYETAFYQWRNAFTAIWPNLLVEPDSERAKVADVKFKSVVAMVETMAPLLGPQNKAALAQWAADQASEQKELFTSPLILDEDELLEEPAALPDDEENEPRVRPFSLES